MEEQGHHPEALAAWDEVFARFRPDPRPGLQEQVASAYLARGVALYHRGEVDRALGSLERGQACVAAVGKEATSRNWLPAHMVQASLLGLEERYEEATEVLTVGLARLPSPLDPDLKPLRARALNSLGYLRILQAKRLWFTNEHKPPIEPLLWEALLALR